MEAHEVLRLRAKLGLSLRAFALLVGVHPNTVWRWEKGETSIHAAHVEKMRQIEEGK